VWDLAGVTTIDQRAMDDFLAEGMAWGEGGYRNGGTATKYLFAGQSLMTEFQWFAKGNLEYRVLDKQIGFACMEYKTNWGLLRLLHSPILDYNHKGWGFLLDLNHVHYVYLQDSDTKLLDNRQGNGIDGTSEEYLSDTGVMVSLEASCAVIKRFKEAV
jgi:hypothetical protein